MVINYRVLPEYVFFIRLAIPSSAVFSVFDLSSLSRALEEDVKAQLGHPAAYVFDVFNLSSLSKALDEDIATQAYGTCSFFAHNRHR
jgi:hypothetical protein